MNYDDELSRTADRLRQLSPARLPAHEQSFAQLLADLAGRPVPRIEPRAWGDQLLVVGRQAPAERMDAEALRDFRRSLDLSVGR